MHRVLKAPLAAKLAGANLLIVVAGWAAGYAAHQADVEWRVLAVMTVAMGIALAVNLVLVAIALRPIRDLERTATQVWAGDLETRVPRSRIADADLAQVGGTLNFLLSSLAEDRARVRMLASQVVRAGDRERSRVGKELHDSIAQSLAALRYQLIAIERDVTDPALADQIGSVRHGAGQVLEQVRLLSHTVHPQILDDLGLVPALRHLARTTTGTGGVTVSVISTGGSDADFHAIPSDASAAVYRVAQESIANAIRHASPKTIVVTIGLAGGALSMQVEDDGTGFDSEKLEGDGAGAMGLFTMRERMSLLGGSFDISSDPRKGTSIRVNVPVDYARSQVPSGGQTQTEKVHAR